MKLLILPLYFIFFPIAVMAGCSSSVKLLCDGGAAVNATDFVRIDLSMSNNVLMFSLTVLAVLKMINAKSMMCVSCTCRLR